ncbi:asparaginase, partial [bacterium]|nr:asparaginase [bacterium]
MPLSALACAMARIANPANLPEHRIEAIRRIRTAWAAHSYLIAGRNTFDTEMIRGSAGQALVKQGAEGVAVAVLPRLGVGIALKIDDGASRARDVAMAALIRHSGVLTKEQWRRMAELETVPVMTRAGRDAGGIHPSSSWIGAPES